MRRPLTRDLILREALRLVDAEGLKALTMRRLGKELGVEAMSLYHHVPGKEALLDGLVELIVLEIEIPSGDGGWRDAQREVLHSYRRTAHAHPQAFPLITTRPIATPEALGRFEAVMTALREAGFDDMTTVAAFRMAAGYVRGFALEEVTGRALGRQPEGAPGRVDLRALPPGEFPVLSSLAPTIMDASADDELFDMGVEMILDGMETRRRRRRG